MKSRTPRLKVTNLKEKLEDLSTKFGNIVREFNYIENDDYARAVLKQFNLELDALREEIRRFSLEIPN